MARVDCVQRVRGLALALIVLSPLSVQSQVPPVKFKTKATYASGGYNAVSVAVGDLNGDGHPDLIVANSCPSVGCGHDNSGQIAVLLGNGNGTFQAAASYPSGGSNATAVAVADVNGDGKLDVAVTNRCRSGHDCSVDNSGEVSVLLGNGNGTLQPAVSYDTGGYSASALVVADVNHDDKPDLLVANECDNLECADVFQPGTIGVLLGNGNGTFQAALSYQTQDRLPESLAAGRIDADDNVDIAVGHRDGFAQVLKGNGDGTFSTFTTTFQAANYQLTSVLLADLNGDGHLDLVATDAEVLHGRVALLLNDGAGKFPPSPRFHVAGFGARDAAVSDLNGDGFPDVAVTTSCQNKNSCTTGRVGFLPGIGAGAFPSGVASAISSSGEFAQGIAIADLDGDGRPDVVATNFCIDLTCTDDAGGSGSVSVLLNSLILATTSTALVSSSNPAKVNQPVTFTATISSSRPVPDGEPVSFSIGTTKLGTGTTVNGVATLTTSFSKAKSYTIKATYPGFAYLGPSSATTKQVVTP